MAVLVDHVLRARATPIERLVEQRGIRLLGRLERSGHCPVCGGRDRFAVNARKQLWNCRGCAKGGDIIALVQHLDGIGFADAVRSLAGEAVATRNEPQPIIKPKPASDDAEQHELRQRAKARRLFNASIPAGGTLAETYLRGRGIVPPLPSTVRFLSPMGERPPAMLVPYGLPDEPEPGVLDIAAGAIAAVHLTLLRPDGAGKADTKPNKITIGSPCGMPLVLSPMADLLGLAVCEGVEDGLSVHQATGLGAWAAGGCTFMPKLVVAIRELAAREENATPECVTIVSDADEGGQRGARELAQALAELGVEVLIEGLQ